MAEKYFRTTEVPVAKFSPESGVSLITVKSPSLKQRGDICIYETKQVKGKTDVPLVILLHGVYGSHWAWMFKGGAYKTAQRLVDAGKIPPIVIACPSDGLWGDGSGYIKHGTQYFEAWDVKDVIQALTENTKSVSEKSRKFISGLSMGGFGALRLGAKYPAIFEAFGGHSSITNFSQMSQFVEEPLASYNCPAEDAAILATLIQNKEHIGKFRFDCGSDDPLVSYNRELHQKLNERQIEHVYEEHSQSHEWGYWQEHLENMLFFY